MNHNQNTIYEPIKNNIVINITIKNLDNHWPSIKYLFKTK